MTDQPDEYDDESVVDDDLAERLADVDEDLAEQRAAALRSGLSDYELDDDDLEVLEISEEGEEGIRYLPALPVIAIVGRPNVGKSALVNRILGRREAVVEDTPGVTRDRVAYKGEYLDRRFTLVDTGGWEPDAKGIDASVAAQAEVAIDLSDVVLFIVDAIVGATSTDEHVVRLLRKTKKPVFLVANKVDDARQEPEAAALWNLGLGQPYPVSALHGRGVADMLEDVFKVLPQVSAVAKDEFGGPRRVAILGRPNVGKSSSAARSGDSSTPPASVVACTCSRAPTSMRRCARRRPSRKRRSRSCCWMSRSRSPSRMCVSSTWCSSRAVRSCWRTTSGISSTTTVAATSSARSSRTCITWRGRRG
jgi:GTP-binding protein